MANIINEEMLEFNKLIETSNSYLKKYGIAFNLEGYDDFLKTTISMAFSDIESNYLLIKDATLWIDYLATLKNLLSILIMGHEDKLLYMSKKDSIIVKEELAIFKLFSKMINTQIRHCTNIYFSQSNLYRKNIKKLIFG